MVENKKVVRFKQRNLITIFYLFILSVCVCARACVIISYNLAKEKFNCGENFELNNIFSYLHF